MITVTNADLPKPLMYRPLDKAPVYTLSEMARLIARPNEDVSGVHNRLKNLAQRLLIYRKTIDGAKPNDPAYFGIEDVATAEVLLALFDIGVRDAEIAELTSSACYAWNDTDNPRPAFIPEHVSPIFAAIVGAMNGESWALRLATFHDEKIGRRHHVAAIVNTDWPLPGIGYLPPSFLPEHDHTMQITRLMLRFSRILRQQATAH